MSKKQIYLIIGIVVAIVVIFVGSSLVKKGRTKVLVEVEQVEKALPVPVAVEEKFKPEFQKGVTYIAWTKDGYSNSNSGDAIEDMALQGIDWACLVVTRYQDKFDSTEIYSFRDKTPSDESIVFAIKKLHGSGIKVMLKPHLDLMESDGKWRGEIGFGDSDSWKAWFESYGNFILKYATLAEKEKVDLFCIGTELTNTTLSEPGLWRELIQKVRAVYTGPLTYAANWDEEFDGIEFWDELDYVGIDPYFPLVSSANPDKEELMQVWGDWLGMIEDWQKQVDKPVLFTEIGYKSAVGATDEPWQHAPLGKADVQLQADCYDALLETFWDKPWFYGVYWWYYGVNTKMGGPFHRGFTPQNKPAQKIVEKWYKQDAPAKKY